VLVVDNKKTKNDNLNKDENLNSDKKLPTFKLSQISENMRPHEETSEAPHVSFYKCPRPRLFPSEHFVPFAFLKKAKATVLKDPLYTLENVPKQK
jgi:hypothetical protein